jgi:hypothetical protein
MAVCDSAEAKASFSHPWLAEAIFALDSRLRRRHKVVEYSADPQCIFRLDIAHASRACILSDGTRLRAGQRIAQLHFWNEQIPSLPQKGATIGWARAMKRRIEFSMQELASYLSSRSDLHDIAVISAAVPCGTRAQCAQLGRIMAHYGFEMIAAQEPQSIVERAHRLGENVLISLIVFARNAKALRLDSLSRVRLPIYLSRRSMEERFGVASVSRLRASR